MADRIHHLQSLADAAHAELSHIAQDLRDTRARFAALDRHKRDIEAKEFKLSAAHAHEHAELAERIEFLQARHAQAQVAFRAKRVLADRCKEVTRG
jgi:hypothetical protein